VTETDALDLPALSLRCKNHPRIRSVIHELFLFDRVSSTNRLAMEMAGSGMPPGVALLAEVQEAGRGRLGRGWFSPIGNLALSLYLRPHRQLCDFPLFSLAASLAVVLAIEKVTGLASQIKWPNDVLMGDRKVAGVLAESTQRSGETSPPLILGIGINVNVVDFPPELQSSATSLALSLGQPIDRGDLLIAFFESFCEGYEQVQAGRVVPLIATAASRCSTLGKRVKIDAPGRAYEGVAEGISPDGALRLRVGDNTIRTLRMDEVTHLR
jgi:biotin-[acetyl-CoA-carboxylase] ligase BirA-like protein